MPDQFEACEQVQINNDNDPESSEVFMVTFKPANPRPPDLTEVIITLSMLIFFNF